MPGNRPLSIYSIPVDRAFADALVSGLLKQHGDDPLALARGMILLPSNRARAAVQAAFVRAAGAGLMLPRLVAIGDAEVGEDAGFAVDCALDETPLPPAIDPLRRRLILSRLIVSNCAELNVPLAEPASLRLADALARVIDQLQFEGLEASALDAAATGEFSQHWQVSMRHLQLLLDQWPGELKRLGCMDLAARRNAILARAADRWAQRAPAAWVVAAGITLTAPTAARLLRVIAELPDGAVVLPGVDTAMPDPEWDALGPPRPDPVEPRPLDSHPQYQFKLLLDRMGVARGEVLPWPDAADAKVAGGRAALASALFIPARFTANWSHRVPRGAADGIHIAEFPDDAAEAQGIALLLRHALEIPGQSAALVTPDRQLALRVSSALARWGIVADDSAGQPLGLTPPAVLTRLVLAAASERSLIALMAMLSHPLVAHGEGRAQWLEQVRRLDLWLRGPGVGGDPAAVEEALQRHRHRLAEEGKADAALDALLLWWQETSARLHPMWVLGGGGAQAPALFVDTLVKLLGDLCGDAIWSGPAGRQLAALLDSWQAAAPEGPGLLSPQAIARQFDDLLVGESVRAPFGTHPRLFIWGLLEARLQRADLMVLGGLNEGGWPALSDPDPWLAPGIRRQLGLPSPHRAQGLAAHDFATALGAANVVVTRAERQGSDPAIASRLWLRLTALAAPLPTASIDGVSLPELAAAIDRPAGPAQPAQRPNVAVAAHLRPRSVRVTALDTLASDPFAFYAEHILRLRPLERLGAPADARWRGTRVHDLLDQWLKRGGDAGQLDLAIAELARDPALDPVESAAWIARIGPALRWVAEAIDENKKLGRTPLGSEIKGEWTANGVTVRGKADRIDQTADGMVIVDYKSGNPPPIKDVVGRRAMQLGLLAAMLDGGGFDGLPAGPSCAAEYWLLKPPTDKLTDGFVNTPNKSGGKIKTFAELIDLARSGLHELTHAYFIGNTPFAPGEHSRGDFDHLARRDEWIGRSNWTERDDR